MTSAAAAAIEITHDTNHVHVAKNLSFPARNNEPNDLEGSSSLASTIEATAIHHNSVDAIDIDIDIDIED